MSHPPPNSHKAIKKASRFLTQLLRHKATDFKLHIRSDGYIRVKDIQDFQERTGRTVLSVDDFRKIVHQDNKMRFSLSEEESTLWIRANQGHSLTCVDETALLTKIKEANEVPVCIHGTTFEAWKSIQTSGLKKMGRNHIHMAVGEPGEMGVISGMRKSSEVLVYINVESALTCGIEFFRSDNNVILSAGPIPAANFSKVLYLGKEIDFKR